MFLNNASRINAVSVNRNVPRSMTKEQFKLTFGQWRSALSMKNYALPTGKKYNEHDLTCHNIFSCVSSSAPTYILSAAVGGMNVRTKSKPKIWNVLVHYSGDRKESIKYRNSLRENLAGYV